MSDVVEPVLAVTDAAGDKMVEVRASEPDADTVALWVEISGEAAGAFSYTMELRPLTEAGPSDAVQRHDDLSVIVAADSIERLAGATLDFTGAGMGMQNPNKPAAHADVAAPPAADPSRPVAHAVLTIPATAIKPAIAAH